MATASPVVEPSDAGSRRNSLISTIGKDQAGKEELAQVLSQIHNSASNPDILTTFNAFASPPSTSNGVEPKGLTEEIIQHGLSGLYNRFRGVVGGNRDRQASTSVKGDDESIETSSIKSHTTNTPVSKTSLAGPTRESSILTASPVFVSTTSSRIQSPTNTSFALHGPDVPSGKPSLSSTPTPTLTAPTRPPNPAMAKASVSSTAVPTVATVHASAFREDQGESSFAKNSFASQYRNVSLESKRRALDDGGSDMDTDTLRSTRSASRGHRDSIGGHRERRSDRASLASIDGAGDSVHTTPSIKLASSTVSSIKSEAVKQTLTQGHLAASDAIKRPAIIDRITQSHLPGYQPSRASSEDRSTAEPSTINTPAHNNVRHDSFTTGSISRPGHPGPIRIPGTTLNEGNPDAVSSKLAQMRKQVLSKEFWMADDNCKECFLCGDAFTAFRRKHHCRTCGCIFDSKCTSIIPGERFGVQGSLRVCKTCLDILNRRYDSSDSDDSEDDNILTSSLFQTHKSTETIQDPSTQARPETPDNFEKDNRPLATPMMAIPATRRRIGDNPNRRSAILEIDAPQLSRPSSARSLKSLTGARPVSAGHRRHHSKHNFLGRLKSTMEDRAPFHRPAADELSKRGKLPTFHDDNIIDPDLAPYMSDEESSGDEQMSIFSALNSDSIPSASLESDRTGLGSLLTAGKKHRSRPGGDKSISGVSFTTRGRDDLTSSGPNLGHLSRNRRRNLSTAGNAVHHVRPSPRPAKQSVMFKGLPIVQDESAKILEKVPDVATPIPGATGTTRMTRSLSMKDAKAPAIELNHASLVHVKRLLQQLLQDADIPNAAAWEKALIPILLQCTDDVNPDVRHGDDIDIRHYVKVKKIPGGRPGDTSYVSGVVFTKNLALKSMRRSIPHPRIVIVSFPIEYQRQQQFMSLEPVIAQEKDFLRNMINRIASLQPQLLLVEKHISGLALQYLAEANIAVAYNVKPSVIEAVSRCAQTEIISSIDMVTLKHVHVGRSEGFDVKTYVHREIPGRKKTYLYISGCPKELGCTIVLRGASMEVLRKMKRITEFMVYVVYNLKLETCLMRDEFVLIPSIADDESKPPKSPFNTSVESERPVQANEAGENENQPQAVSQSDTTTELLAPAEGSTSNSLDVLPMPRLVSAHQSHIHEYHVPEDVPMPTYYSDMVSKHQTKILSASPFVKFSPPYLLMRSREQERRLEYLRRLRDQDAFEEQTDSEKPKPQKFQLIKPEMVHNTIKGAPRQIMEVLHAVHDAEYDKALHNYQTQTRQWENYIQGNLNLFDPYAHQNIVVLYTLVCTATTVPCAGPDLVALGFYDDHENTQNFDPDCTLGQYVEDLCLSANTLCDSNVCDRTMFDHHRTYVHGEARITVFLEKLPCKIKGMQDSILMWSYCKKCQKETPVMPMSESTWKYSFGKYLELSFWSTELHLRENICGHDIHRDHLRYFGFANVAIRIHYDPIDLLEIVVPRTRITWKVDHDLLLKNELFTKAEERWTRFMLSVKARIESINIDSVSPDKMEACQAEREKLAKRAVDEHAALIRKLQDKYMNSKYYEIIPLNRAVRAMQEKVVEWDAAFADFDRNFFPSEKDIRRLAAIQLKKIFMDDDSTVSLVSTETAEPPSDADEKSPSASLELPSGAQSSEDAPTPSSEIDMENELLPPSTDLTPQAELDREALQPLDLATPMTEQSVAIISTDDEVTPGADVTPKADETRHEFPLQQPVEERPATPVERSPSPIGDDVQTPKAPQPANFPDVMDIPRPPPARQRGANISPPMNRAHTQPVGTLRRVQAPKIFSRDSKSSITREIGPFRDEMHRAATSESLRATDKKLSERLGLKSLNRKTGHSMIPRSVQVNKRKDSKVSSLAKHFEQLSREFEKERMRDRKQRAAKATQSRAFPKASSKPIVEVYKDVNEAVAERVQADDYTHTPTVSTTSVDHHGIENQLKGKEKIEETAPEPESATEHTDATATADETETATEAETDDNMPTASQAGSDDEGAASDVEGLLDIRLPDAAQLAESLRESTPNNDSQLELPRHEKTSLMKMLSKFWAERSASGWIPLDYPLNFQDHVFADSDVIVREDEPSSLIAFALNSQDYRSEIETVRQQPIVHEHPPQTEKGELHDLCNDNINQVQLEKTLLQERGKHMKFQFQEGSARMLCKIFYAEQFDALRQKCGVADRIVESLSRCLKWDSKGGKTKSVFLKTLDDRWILKSLSPIETNAFLQFAPAYFNIMAEILFHELPSAIAKMLGFYQVVIKNPATNTDIKLDLLLMENLFYDRSPARIFDLKGSMRNRKIQSTGEQNEVLLDENMVEFIYESPLFAREHSKKLLRASVWNDTLFLARQNVMDYSLMIAVDEDRQELVVGIIDCIRTYTWDKKLESWIKDRGFAGGGRNRPTVTSPKEYKSRFREAMARYVLQAPNCWHQFQQPSIATGQPVNRSASLEPPSVPIRPSLSSLNDEKSAHASDTH